MSFIRTVKNNNFTTIDNTGLRDTRLSWKATGLLAYMLHLPNDWKIYVTDLIKRKKDGKDSVQSAMKELMEFGYMERYSIKENGRFAGYEYVIYEAGTYRGGKSAAEKPHTGNPQLLNTNIPKTKELNTNVPASPETDLFGEESPKEKKEKKVKADSTIVLERYSALFAETSNGIEPTIQHARDRSILKPLLTQYGLEKVLVVMDLFFKDEWAKKRGFTLLVFKTDFQKFLVQEGKSSKYSDGFGYQDHIEKHKEALKKENPKTIGAQF